MRAFLQRKSQNAKQKSSEPVIVIVSAGEKKYSWIYYDYVLFKKRKLHSHGGQQRALSDRQSVSLVHFHLLLISQEPPSCSATPAVTSSSSHFGVAAGFPIGRDVVMSGCINEFIKHNACGLLFGMVRTIHRDTHNCQCAWFFASSFNVTKKFNRFSWERNDTSRFMFFVHSDMLNNLKYPLKPMMWCTHSTHWGQLHVMIWELQSTTVHRQIVQQLSLLY